MAVGVAACDDLVGTAPSVAWTTSSVSEQHGIIELAPTISLDGRHLRIEGFASGPTWCYSLDPRARTIGQVIELQVRAVEPPRAGCGLTVRDFTYVAEAEHPRGQYRLIARYQRVREGRWVDVDFVIADTILVIE